MKRLEGKIALVTGGAGSIQFVDGGALAGQPGPAVTLH